MVDIKVDEKAHEVLLVARSPHEAYSHRYSRYVIASSEWDKILLREAESPGWRLAFHIPSLKIYASIFVQKATLVGYEVYDYTTPRMAFPAGYFDRYDPELKRVKRGKDVRTYARTPGHVQADFLLHAQRGHREEERP